MSRPEIAIVRACADQLPDVQRLAGVIWRAHYSGIISAAQIEYMLARGYARDALAGFLGAPTAASSWPSSTARSRGSPRGMSPPNPRPPS